MGGGERLLTIPSRRHSAPLVLRIRRLSRAMRGTVGDDSALLTSLDLDPQQVICCFGCTGASAGIECASRHICTLAVSHRARSLITLCSSNPCACRNIAIRLPAANALARSPLIASIRVARAPSYRTICCPSTHMSEHTSICWMLLVFTCELGQGAKQMAF